MRTEGNADKEAKESVGLEKNHQSEDRNMPLWKIDMIPDQEKRS